MTFESIARFVIALSAAVYAIGYFTVTPPHWLDLGNSLLLEAILLLLYVVSGRFSKKYPVTRLATFTIYTTVCSRIIVVLFRPEWLFVNYRTTINTMQVTLTYFLLGSIVCFLGIGFGSSWAGTRRKNDVRPVTDMNSLHLLCASLFVSCLLLYLNLKIFGFSGTSGNKDYMNFFSRYITRIFEPFLMVVMVWVAYYLLPKKTYASRKIFQFSLFVFVVFRLGWGSRSAIYDLAIFYICLRPVAGQGALFWPKITLSRAMGIAIFIALLPWGFMAANSLRDRFDVLKIAYMVNEESALEQLSRRVSLVEQTMFPLNQEEMNMHNIDDKVNFETTFLSSLNRITPGKPFGKTLGSEYYWCFLLQADGCIEYSILDRVEYVGNEWGMWGISYQLFGYVGGLAFIFVFTAFICYFAQVFYNRNTYTSLCFYFLAAYSLHFWIRNLGLDHWVDFFGHDFLLLAIYLAIWNWCTKRVTRQVIVGMPAPAM